MELQKRRSSHHPMPYGTPDELREMSLDPSTAGGFGSCSEPGKKNAGCPEWDVCDFDFKGKSRQAPEFVVYRFIKGKANGSGMREGCAMCWAAMRLKRTIETQPGGVFDLIGGPGTKYLHQRSKPRSIVALDSFVRDNATLIAKKDPAVLKELEQIRAVALNPNHRDSLTQVPVAEIDIGKKFPRPRENPDLAEVKIGADLRERAREQEVQRRRNERLGLSLEDDEEEETEIVPPATGT